MAAINNLPGLAKFNNATHETDGLMSRNDKQKLDTLHKSVTVNATLYASQWSANRPYTQTIELFDIRPETNGNLTIDPLATEEEVNACIDADINIVEQGTNYITLQVLGQKPEIDIPIIVVFGENLAVITPPTIVDTGNHVYDITIQPSDWVSYLDTYKVTLSVPGLNESITGSISMKSGVHEDEAFAAAKARIEILNIYDDTLELILKGEKPSIPLHVTLYYGPSISVVRRPVFGGKITPSAEYQEFDDSKTKLGVTNTQSAIEAIVTGELGIDTKTTHFKTIDVLKQQTNLQVGQLVQTSGYRTENDGGGATYIITSNYHKDDDGGSVHVLKNDLRAEIVLSRGEDINLKCFGFYGDEIHDDTPAFKRGFDYCKEIKGGTVRWQGTAALSEQLVIDSHFINLQGYGFGSTLKANAKMQSVLSITYEEYATTEEMQQVVIGNFRIDGYNRAVNGLIVDNNLSVFNSIIENIHITNTTGYGLLTYSCKNTQFNLISTYNTYGGIMVYDAVTNTSFTNCEVIRSAINPALEIDGYDDSMNVNFHNCYFGECEVESLISINRCVNTEFTNCTFDFRSMMDTSEYAILIKEKAIYTRFINCFVKGTDKVCGIFKNNGPDTEIRNLKAVDIKSDIHVLSVDNIHISDMLLLGDSTPLIIYTPNEDKTILDVDSSIKTVNDDNELFPANANYYNIYMNQTDDVGIKGKLNNYVLDKHLEHEVMEVTYTATDASVLKVENQLQLEGVWEVDLFLSIDDGNQGKISKYQVVFKENSVYSIANIQELTAPISWGNSIVLNTSIDKYGKLVLEYIDTTTRYTWTLLLKAKRIIGF